MKFAVILVTLIIAGFFLFLEEPNDIPKQPLSVPPSKPTEKKPSQVPAKILELSAPMAAELVLSEIPHRGDSDDSSLFKKQKLNLDRRTLTKDDFINLNKYSSLKNLNLSGSQFKMADLLNIRHNLQITSIDLSNTEIKDNELSILVYFLGLKHINLNNTSISDQGLKDLKHLANLVRVDADGTTVTPEGLKNLAQHLGRKTLSFQKE